MKYNVFTYLVGEGFSNIFKNKKQAFTSFGTMCLIMIFFGLCFIIVGNFNHFIKLVESQQGIQAFVKKDATEEDLENAFSAIMESISKSEPSISYSFEDIYTNSSDDSDDNFEIDYLASSAK